MTKYFTRSKVFLFVLISFIIGIFFSPYVWEFLSGLSLIVILLNCYIVVLLLIIFRRKKLFFYFLIFLITCFFGVWRYQGFLPKINECHIAFYNDNKEVYLVEGVIGSEPVEKNNNLQFQISNIVLIPNNQCPNPNQYLITNNQLEGEVLVSVPKYYEVNYGDQVQFKAKLATPNTYDTFDYKDYLARYGVYAIAKGVDGFTVIANYANSGELSRIEKGKYFVGANLYKIKNYFSSIIQKIYPEPHGSFMLGLLLGAKTSLPDWLINTFKIIGITHIIAISGYNITILAKVAEKTLGKIGRKFIFWGVLAMIVSFVIMTGAQASIVRAGVMGGLLVYAGFIGRRGNAINVLVLAGAVMIFLNPLILRNDIGFQLSFLATLGLVFISPIFEKWFARIPEFFRIMLSATLAAQVLTLPIIISSFGKLSLISPIANVIILGFIPLSMFLGFASGLIGMIWLPLGKIVGFFGYIILDVIIKISEVLARIPYASVELKVSGWVVWGGYYAVVGVLVWLWHRRNKNQKVKH